MHWLAKSAARAGIPAANTLEIPEQASISSAWDIASRTLGIKQDELAAIVSSALGFAVAELNDADAAAIGCLSERLARQYHVLPLREEARRIIVATADPTNIQAEQAIAFATGRRVIFVVATPTQIEEGLFSAYGSDQAIDHFLTSTEELADVVKIVEELEPEAIVSAEIDAAPVVRFANLILRDAIRQGASDIHIEPGARSGIVRFRVDGVMHRYTRISLNVLHRVVSRIKVLARLDIAERSRPQDGRSRAVVDGRAVDLRISTVCARDAEKAVIRILRPESARTIEQVGLAPRELDRLRQLLDCRNGIVIVTGPTGSGKTTTMYAAVRELATEHVNISTVEDPVEYELSGVTQIQVDPKRGVTFANSLRALLRQDPDVIFIGEIRDQETAEIAARAAMTGHLVLATLHTNDAMSAVARLSDLGLDRQTIAATLRGALSQRLVRRVCAHCAQPVNGQLTVEEEQLRQRYGASPVVRAAGCHECAHTGYRGRVPLVEVALVTDELSNLIASGAPAVTLQSAAAADGMSTMRENAVVRLLYGQTTLQEIQRVLGDTIQSSLAKAGTPGRASILLVNPDPAWRKLARALLERDDVRVVEAPDAADAMRRLSAGERFSLILTDMRTPDCRVSDRDAVERLPRLEALPSTFPIRTTAN